MSDAMNARCSCGDCKFGDVGMWHIARWKIARSMLSYCPTCGDDLSVDSNGWPVARPQAPLGYKTLWLLACDTWERGEQVPPGARFISAEHMHGTVDPREVPDKVWAALAAAEEETDNNGTHPQAPLEGRPPRPEHC